MKLLKMFTLFFVVTSLLFTNAYAAKFYRRIPVEPFTLSLKPGDTLVVNYNFAEKNGVYCTSHSNKIRMDYVYKGHQKFTYLPVFLQSHHVPKEGQGEELADASGQFNLSISQNELKDKQYEISCGYADDEIK